jgi:cytochrome P450 family 150 subfamily A5
VTGAKDPMASAQAISDYHFLKLNEDLLQNPYPFFQQLRARGPVCQESDYGVYLVGTLDAIREVNRQPEVFSSILVANAPYVDLPCPLDRIAEYRQENPFSDKILSNDPPDHTRHRKLINRFFTTSRVRALEPRIRQIANEIIDSFIDAGEVEFVTGFAHMLPRLVVGELIGLPETDQAHFRRFFEDRLELMAEAAQQPLAGFQERTRNQGGLTEDVFLRDYFTAAIRSRRRQPQDDIMSELAIATFDDGEPVPLESVVSMIVLLYAAGGDANTPELMTNAMLALLERPELEEALRGDPSLARPFIEEVLRYDTPVPGVFRIALQDTTIAGVPIPKGAKIMVVYGAANHDEGYFEEPECFRMGRDYPHPHLGFGIGVHFCPGAPLARLEGQVAVQEVLRRLVRIRRADEGPVPYVPSVIQRIPIRLRLAFDRAGTPSDAGIQEENR